MDIAVVRGGGLTPGTRVGNSHIVRMAPDGTHRWAVYQEDRLVGVCIDPFGNVIVVGDTFVTNRDPVITKYNPFGQLLWSFDFPAYKPSFNGNAVSVDADASGNIYVGILIGDADFGDPHSILKLNADGEDQWETLVPFYRHLRVDPTTSEVYSVGFLTGTATDGRVFKLDADGNEAWMNFTHPWIPLGVDLGGPDNENVSTSSRASTSQHRFVRISEGGTLVSDRSWSFPITSRPAIDKDASEKYVFAGIDRGSGFTELWKYLWAPGNFGGTLTPQWDYLANDQVEYIEYGDGFINLSDRNRLTQLTSDGGDFMWMDESLFGFTDRFVRDIAVGPEMPPAVIDLEATFTGSSVFLTWGTEYPMSEFAIQRERWTDESEPPPL